MAALSSQLRGVLERAVLAGRAASESAADAALNMLGLTTSQPYATLTPEQRRLRVALRARARQLGDGSVEQGRHLLVEEIAYEQWHRMLFARFLAENALLMHPSGVAVTLEECAELASDESEPDAWSLAARYASAMLPGIFRVEDPASQVRYAPEGRTALESIVGGLPKPVFQAGDALGWVYQFWQTKAKDEVNKSGRKIGAEELPAVTQLFTEDYMVRFLLENTLGAWWAGKYPDSRLLGDFGYLHFKDDGAPAAGTFPDWPQQVAEITVMDPCCGSGHFLVAAFEMLRWMRMEEEGLSEQEAGDAVLRDNIHGLEIDPRCTQIAAFALAFAAWKSGGYRCLPLLDIACSGIPVKGQLDEWTKLAGGDVNLMMTLEQMYALFKDAPTLGSLINPEDIADPLFVPNYSKIETVLQQALAQEQCGLDPVAEVFGWSAQGSARAADLLSRQYTLVVTNVPYLNRSSQSQVMRSFCADVYAEAMADLATSFLYRCLAFSGAAGTTAAVTPQSWLSQPRYESMRRNLLTATEWSIAARLGTGAFETISGEVVNVVLIILKRGAPPSAGEVAIADVADITTAGGKALALKRVGLRWVRQMAQLDHPDARFLFSVVTEGLLLSSYAVCIQGLATSDDPQFTLSFWEVGHVGKAWERLRGTVESTRSYGGCERLLLWEGGAGRYYRHAMALKSVGRLGGWKSGTEARGRRGVIVSQMGDLPVSLYLGEFYDHNASVILPRDEFLLAAIWAYCSSPEFSSSVRNIDRSLKPSNNTLVKVPFDLEHWQKVADEAGPLPEAFSNDPTQWLFRGDPADSTEPLQVAAARLLDYHWPDQQCDQLDVYADGDGIACLPPVAGGQPGTERLRALLAAAYGDAWSRARQDELVAQAGCAAKDLNNFLRDNFFAKHCQVFHNRPFIWHIWDGRGDGFSALINYHKLDSAGLNRLTYTYLGSWIETQRADQAAGEAGADGRLVAALELQRKLQLIAEGDPPYDIYVRWKPLHEQPIGWNPDLNDGVRLNIRPFVTAGVLRSKFTINWKKDRGMNPDGSERFNDLHLSNAEKRAAREAAGVR